MVTTTSIIGSLAQEVAGDTASIETLIDPGVDPHLYEFTTDDARLVSDADLVLINGIELDEYIIPDIESANSDVPIVAVTDGIELIGSSDDGGEHHADESHEHDHSEYDPHVWQDPLRVKQMVENIAAALEDQDPDNQTSYSENARRYNRQLDETHEEIQQLIAEIPESQRKLVTNHDAFSYFADRYELEIIGSVIPGLTTEADPSAQDIAELTELIEREEVRAILVAELVDPKVAEQLAADTGVEIIRGLYTEQVGEPGSGAETVHGMLLANTEKIHNALTE